MDTCNSRLDVTIYSITQFGLFEGGEIKPISKPSSLFHIGDLNAIMVSCKAFMFCHPIYIVTKVGTSDVPMAAGSAIPGRISLGGQQMRGWMNIDPGGRVKVTGCGVRGQR